MKIEKLNQALVKDYFKNAIHGVKGDWMVAKAEGSEMTGLVLKGHALYLLHPKELLCDIEKILRGSTPANLKGLLAAEPTASDAVATGNKKVTGKKLTCVEFKKNDDGSLVYVNEEYLKHLGDLSEYIVKVISPTSYIFFYDRITGELRSMICPVKINV